MGNIQRSEYDSTDTPTVIQEDWMRLLPDGVTLDQVAIPGSSRSMSIYGGDSIQAQSWNLEKQLRAGIRAFDLHFMLHGDGTLKCWTGVDQGSTFEDIEKVFAVFLKTHPSEFIVLSVYEEKSPFLIEKFLASGNANSTNVKPRKFMEELKYKIDWVDCFWRKTAKKMPSVGQVRGKIVLLTGPYGIPENMQLTIPEPKRAFTVFDLQAVWDQRCQHLRLPLGKRMRVTEIAASESGCYPHTAAKNLNAWFLDNILKYPMPLGVVFFYFPGTGLIKTIIDLNSYLSKLLLDKPDDMKQLPLIKGKFGSEGSTYIMECYIEDIQTLACETRYTDENGLLVTALVINNQRFGANGGEASQSVSLQKNEIICKISGYSDWCIQCLDIHTSKGNRLCAGSGDGKPFSINVGKGDKLSLLYSDNHLHSIYVFGSESIQK